MRRGPRKLQGLSQLPGAGPLAGWGPGPERARIRCREGPVPEPGNGPVDPDPDPVLSLNESVRGGGDRLYGA